MGKPLVINLSLDEPALIRTAFTLGFLVSREGFNAGCPYDHLAPSELPTRAEIREFIAREETAEEEADGESERSAFLRLREAAVQRLTTHQREAREDFQTLGGIAPARCRVCGETSCYHCPECGEMCWEHKAECTLDPNRGKGA